MTESPADVGTEWVFRQIWSKHLLFFWANSKWLWQKRSPQIGWLALGANPNFERALCLSYGALFTPWWESQTSELSKLLGWVKLFACHIFYYYYFFLFHIEKIKPRGRPITKQTFNGCCYFGEAFKRWWRFCFLLSPFQLPSVCLSRKEFLLFSFFFFFPETHTASCSYRHNTHLHLGLVPLQSGTIR